MKHRLCSVQSGVVMGKNWARTIDQRHPQGLQFSVYLIDLWSILLRHNGFPGVQKAVVDQTCSRPPSSDHVWVWGTIGFGKCFRASESNHWAGCCWLPKIHFLLHVTIWSRNDFLFLHRIREDKMIIFLIFLSAHEAPTYWAFTPFQFASNAGFFGIFSCGYERITFDDPFSWSLSTSSGWPQCSSSSSLSSPLKNVLNHHGTVHSLAVSGPNALLMLWVVFTALWSIWTQIRKLLKFAFCLTSFP